MEGAVVAISIDVSDAQVRTMRAIEETLESVQLDSVRLLVEPFAPTDEGVVVHIQFEGPAPEVFVTERTIFEDGSFWWYPGDNALFGTDFSELVWVETSGSQVGYWKAHEGFEG